MTDSNLKEWMRRRSVLTLLGFLLAYVPSLSTRGNLLPPVLQESSTVKLPGAMVSDAEQASRLAMDAYFHRVPGLSAMQGPSRAVLVELGFSVNEYAKVGDKVWEVRITALTQDGNRALCAIVWIHSQTGQPYFLCFSSGSCRPQPIEDRVSETGAVNVGKHCRLVKEPESVTIDLELKRKLSFVKRRMKLVRNPKGIQEGLVRKPTTKDEAFAYLSRYVNMACLPSFCAEHDGLFFFSGGTSSKEIRDFSSGLAIDKGDGCIFSWDSTSMSTDATYTPQVKGDDDVTPAASTSSNPFLNIDAARREKNVLNGMSVK